MMSPDSAAFLRDYFRGTEGRIYLAAIRNPKSKMPAGEIDKLLTREPGEIARFVAEYDRPECDCAIYYCTATLHDGRAKRDAAACQQFPSLFADCDDTNHELDRGRVVALLEGLECPPTMIVDSGHGLQPQWLLDEPSENAERIVAARQKLQELVASDKVHDAPRFMRLPGSHNSKKGDWLPVKIVAHHPERRYALEVLEEWIDRAEVVIPRKPKPAKPNGADKPFVLPPAGGSGGTDHRRGAAWAGIALEASARELAHAGEGERHNTLLAKAVRMATMVARGWIDVQEVRRTLFAASQTCGQIKDYGIGHFEQTFADGFKHGMAMPHPDLTDNDPRPDRLPSEPLRDEPALAPPHTEYPASADGERDHAPPLAPPANEDKGFRILSKREFIDGFVPPDYLLDGILQRCFIYSLTAQTGHGKTALALLVASLVGGSDPKAALGRHPAEKGQVVYFAGENPVDLQMRVIGEEVLCSDDNARIWFIPGTFSIEAMKAKIESEIERLGGVDLVIVDTSAAYFNGKDELSNTEMGAHARMLRTLTTLPGGPCVLVLCHPVKHVTDPSQLLPRGGGAFLAEVDGNLTLWKHDGVMLDLHHTDKLRGPGFEPISLRLETVTTTRLMDKKGRLIPTVRAAWMSDAETERETEHARSDEDTLLSAMLIPGRSIADLATACGWVTSKGEPHKSKVDRTMKRLAADKFAIKKRSTWVLSDAGKKAAETAASNVAHRNQEARRFPT
jgi:hypothetical protein